MRSLRRGDHGCAPGASCTVDWMRAWSSTISRIRNSEVPLGLIRTKSPTYLLGSGWSIGIGRLSSVLVGKGLTGCAPVP
jgi:hypothetical protein